MQTFAVVIDVQVDAESPEVAMKRVEALLARAEEKDSEDWDYELVSVTLASTTKL